jgi:hypothetical protein
MRRLLLLAVAVGGCGSSSPSDRLIGEWLFTNADGSGGIGLTFKADDTYVAAVLVATSASSLNGQIETGNYSATASAVTFTPRQSSCPGPDRVDTESYSFSGMDLVMAGGSTVITFAPNNASSSTTTVVLTTGCFDSTGAFTSGPVAPVSN